MENLITIPDFIKNLKIREGTNPGKTDEEFQNILKYINYLKYDMYKLEYIDYIRPGDRYKLFVFKVNTIINVLDDNDKKCIILYNDNDCIGNNRIGNDRIGNDRIKDNYTDDNINANIVRNMLFSTLYGILYYKNFTYSTIESISNIIFDYINGCYYDFCIGNVAEEFMKVEKFILEPVPKSYKFLYIKFNDTTKYEDDLIIRRSKSIKIRIQIFIMNSNINYPEIIYLPKNDKIWISDEFTF